MSRAKLPIRWIVAATIAALSLAIVLQPFPFLIRHLKDDSFYYFQTANNIALGYGSTFDRINQTNGYHPLWMLNIIPVYWAFPHQPILALRIILVLVAIYHSIAALKLFQVISRTQGAALAAAVSLGWGMCPIVLRMNLNGMESALYALVLAFWVAWAARLQDADPAELRSWRTWAYGGALGALCVMARLDAALLVAAMALWVIVRRHGLWAACLIVLPSFCALVIYMAINQALFGIPLPVSGLIKQAAIPAGMWDAVVQLLWPLAPIMRRVGEWPTMLAVLAAMVAVACLPGRLRQAIFARHGWLWMGCALLYTYIAYSKTFIANWYYVPFCMLAALVAADLCGLALAACRSPRWRAGLGAAAALGVCCAYGMLATLEFNPRKNDTIAQTLEAAEWIRTSLPEGSIGGAWSAGILAYFSGRQVVNLDGLINSYPYYQAMSRGQAPAFVAAEGVSYVFDMFPAPPAGDTAAFVPDPTWQPYLVPFYERRYEAKNVGISSLFSTMLPVPERDASFMWKVWKVELPQQP
ncbi:hypothetical protein F8S13_10210 [Chloroflexia bacterium SDU3-3]|nr:hypothetical protein F8S13_10210 [Chloroflexia bacterium SDU3-3]